MPNAHCDGINFLIAVPMPVLHRIQQRQHLPHPRLLRRAPLLRRANDHLSRHAHPEEEVHLDHVARDSAPLQPGCRIPYGRQVIIIISLLRLKFNYNS